MQLYGVENSRVLDYPYTPYPSFLGNLIVNYAELPTCGVYNPTAYLNINTTDTKDTSTFTYVIPKSTFLPNFMVNSAAL